MFFKIIYIIIVVIWCMVIFFLSNMNGTKSNSESKKIIKNFFDKIIRNKLDDTMLNKLNAFLRKCMHAGVFCVLGILISLCLNSFEIHNWKFLIISLSLSFLYACSDEFHQKFVDGRTPAFTDVLIDTSGACIGIALVFLLH